jgi:hypothetical protein
VSIAPNRWTAFAVSLVGAVVFSVALLTIAHALAGTVGLAIAGIAPSVMLLLHLRWSQ